MNEVPLQAMARRREVVMRGHHGDAPPAPSSSPEPDAAIPRYYHPQAQTLGCIGGCDHEQARLNLFWRGGERW